MAVHPVNYADQIGALNQQIAQKEKQVKWLWERAGTYALALIPTLSVGVLFGCAAIVVVGTDGSSRTAAALGITGLILLIIAAVFVGCQAGAIGRRKEVEREIRQLKLEKLEQMAGRNAVPAEENERTRLIELVPVNINNN